MAISGIKEFERFLSAPPGSDRYAANWHERMHEDSDTYIQRDDQLLIGQHRLGHWPHRSISVWLGSPYLQPDPNPDVEERMLRYGFQSRTRDWLTPMASDDYGTGISIPLWTTTDPAGVEALVISLQADLRTLISGRPAGAGEVDSLTEELVLSAMSPRCRDVRASVSVHGALIKQLCADHHIEDLAQDNNFIEFLFADLPVRAHAHPYLPCVLFDFFVLDACALQGSVRTLLMQTLLALNQTSSSFSSMSVGMDNRHFIVATAYASIEELHHHFQPLLERWLELAFDIRGLCKTLVLEGATMAFEASPGSDGEFM